MDYNDSTNPIHWMKFQSPQGIPYYYNLLTNISQWEKPDSLKTDDEKNQDQFEWQELQTSDGKLFYVNLKQKKSQWRLPQELKAFRQKQIEEKQQVQKIELKTGLRQLEEEKQQKEADKIAKEKDKFVPDATQIFMSVLKDCGITSSMKWDQVQKTIQNDSRNNVIKTISEKKKLLQQFVTNKKKEERQEARSKIDEIREQFFKMLQEAGQKLNSSSKFYKAAGQFIQDYRWKQVDERERELLFQDYLDDLLLKEREQQRKDNQAQLKESIIQNSQITHQTKWEEFCEIFKSDPVYAYVSEYDRICSFSDAINELERQYYNEKNLKKKNQERKNRDEFKKLLKEQYSRQIISHKSKWKHFIQLIKDDQRLWNMLGQSGSSPRELFEDYLDELRNNHKQMKDNLKNLLKKLEFNLNPSTTQEEFFQKMSVDDWFKSLNDQAKFNTYIYCLSKAKSKDKEQKKKEKKQAYKFFKYLKSLNLNENSTFEEILPGIESIQDQISNLSQELRQSLFQTYKKEGDNVFRDSSEKKKKKDKRKKKKRSESHSKEKKKVKQQEDQEKVRIFQPEKKSEKMEIEPIEEGQIVVEPKKDDDFYDKKKKEKKRDRSKS